MRRAPFERSADSFTRSKSASRQTGMPRAPPQSPQTPCREDGANPSPTRDCKAEEIPRVPLSRIPGTGRPRGAMPPSQETDGVRNRESRKRSRTRGQPLPPARDGRGGSSCVFPFVFCSFVVSVVCPILFFPWRISPPRKRDPATLTGTYRSARRSDCRSANQRATLPSAGEPMRAVSGSDGRFALALAPGRIASRFRAIPYSRSNRKLQSPRGETRDLQVRMALEPLSSKVMVTAQTLPLDAESSPAPLTILTREYIDQRVATSLPDLLATQPGFSLGRTGPEGGTASLFLDGGNSNYTKVLVDGAPVNQPGGLIDFSNFTLDNIDKIEIVHGAESALYGSDAMDGVIQIFTHRGTTRIPEFTVLRTAAISTRAAAARTFRACSADSIIPPDFPISKPKARARTTLFATARSPEISAGAFRTPRK